MLTRRQATIGFFYCVLLFSSCNGSNDTTTVIPDGTSPNLKTTTLVNNHEIIWGMDFLPNGDILFTEKRGRIYRYTVAGVTEELTGVPTGINTNGQGGLLDIKVHPSYASNGWIYISYAINHTGGGSLLRLTRFKLNGNAITNTENLFTTQSANTWYGHYGSRIVFDSVGMLYLSIGEGGTLSYGGASSANQNAQDTKNDWGKVHRMTDDGKIPSDNPVLPGNTAATTVFSYGHRNPQGMIFDPVNNRIWENEHGPMGGDEINLIQKGNNYGWPLVCYGKNYDGVAVSSNPTAPGITNPTKYWDPSIAPSGLAVITSNNFKSWKGSLLTGSLKFNYVSRATLQGDKITGEEKILEGIGRVRNIKQGPDGNIYVSVEGPGRIIKVTAE
ncbi:PQQ-dependent sugar dehydrogenase [Sediminibacterium goheungense]|uniref:Glucose/arabinose dehydrogenase n=1 Tax=Sediminibacterium goheungense TaxID=1086393 RepID=A0A4R6IT41_9BACT|nr:PQQ-dependent sugar dehydrogenase [Sediminibacterium goheungense]TDO25156.1 glucose/arabinose dehydrogenase [Sediminibacterium goheungense]